MTSDKDRCHWVKGTDGLSVLIPGCWSRVHNPEAVCLCGFWSEEMAAATIKSLRAVVYRERHRNQVLSEALRANGIADPAAPPIETLKQYTARQRRRALHQAITEADQSAIDFTTRHR